jgi:hypothetical protein
MPPSSALTLVTLMVHARRPISPAMGVRVTRDMASISLAFTCQMPDLFGTCVTDPTASVLTRLGIVCSADRLPAPIRLATGGPVGLMLFAANGDRLRVLAAILPGGGLIGPHRCHHTAIATVRIAPGHALP